MPFRLLVLLLSLFVVGCTPKTVVPNVASVDKMGEAAPAGNVKRITYDEVVDLVVGESVEIAKTETAFTFTQVLSDSRCPTGVNCVQAGEAVLLISLPGGGSLRVNIPAAGRVPARFSVPGGNVNVLKLSPYPKGQEKINPENYVMTFKIGKASVD